LANELNRADRSAIHVRFPQVVNRKTVLSERGLLLYDLTPVRYSGLFDLEDV
jgi:hypothetical protein